MAKRLAVVGAVVGVVALAISMVLPAAAENGGRTIRVVSVLTEEELLDLGSEGFSLGDEFIFSSDLWKQDRRVGRSGVVCTVTSVEHEESQCVATASFGNGQITAQGIPTGPERFVLPITGGSGAFSGAEGQVHVRQVSETREILTFHLEE
jgi:hypothetical protein